MAARREFTCILYHERGSIKSYPRAGVATVAILPDRENWATYPNKMLRGRARIFHFWASAYGGKIPAGTLLGHLIARFRRDGALDEAALACATRNNFPWMHNDVGLRHLLTSGLYLRATALVAPRVARRIARKLSR